MAKLDTLTVGVNVVDGEAFSTSDVGAAYNNGMRDGISIALGAYMDRQAQDAGPGGALGRLTGLVTTLREEVTDMDTSIKDGIAGIKSDVQGLVSKQSETLGKIDAKLEELEAAANKVDPDLDTVRQQIADARSQISEANAALDAESAKVDGVSAGGVSADVPSAPVAPIVVAGADGTVSGSATSTDVNGSATP